MKMKILGKQVLVRPEKTEKQTKSGIVISEFGTQSKILRNTFPFIGEVLQIGGNVYVDCGVAVGDRVIYLRWGTTPLTIEEEEYLLIPISDVLAVIE